jgi:FAD-dependent halogenase
MRASGGTRRAEESFMEAGGAEQFDLIVVGGGPGGATLATFVATQGHRVLVLERERFPRYQIGESLLPLTVHGICQRLGVADELREAGFTRKRGGTFRWGKNPEPWSFSFGDHPMLASTGAGYAYQVERSRFDAILLGNARRKGAVVREEHAVTELVREDERVVGLRFTDDQGRSGEARARFVVDASGNQSRLYQHAGERVYSQFFQNVALFGYFEGGRRLPEPNEGNILSAAFSDGWFWYIPLSKTLTSVGAVIAREHADQLKQGHEEALLGFIESCPIIRDFLAGARRVTEGPYGQVRVRRDWSYSNTRFWAPGLALIGDAACFIDPVFSSGVHLATYSALLAARSINTLLAGELEEEACFNEFERRYRAEFGNFYRFLVGFYDMHKDEESHFWSARQLLRSEERSNEAFIRLVAGASSTAEEFLGGIKPPRETSMAPLFAPRALDGLSLPAAERLGAAAGRWLISSADGMRWISTKKA